MYFTRGTVHAQHLANSTFRGNSRDIIKRIVCEKGRSHRIYCASAGKRDTTTTQAQTANYKIHKVAGDGRCLFRSIVQGAYSNVLREQRSDFVPLRQDVETRQADELRYHVCEELLKRAEEFSPFLEMDIDEYVACMKRPGTWGGEPEISVASRYVLKRKICVHGVARVAGQNMGTLCLISEYEPDEVSQDLAHTPANDRLKSWDMMDALVHKVVALSPGIIA